MINPDLGGCKPQSSQCDICHPFSDLNQGPVAGPRLTGRTGRAKSWAVTTWQSRGLGPSVRGNDDSIILQSIDFSKILTPLEWKRLHMLHRDIAGSCKVRPGRETVRENFPTITSKGDQVTPVLSQQLQCH